MTAARTAYDIIRDSNHASAMMRAGIKDRSREPLLGPPDDMTVSRVILAERPEITAHDADLLAVKINDALAATQQSPTTDADEEDAYQIGKRDGYEEAVQDIDLATGGDGEYKATTHDGVIDMPVMKARVIERLSVEGWQDISTAPKTDEANMVAVPFIGWCPEPEADGGGDQRICWWEPKTDGGKWWSDRDLPEKPTHWRPLPAPPVPSVSGGEDNSPSLRDTQTGSADGSSSNEGAA